MKSQVVQSWLSHLPKYRNYSRNFDTAPHWNTQLLLSTFVPDQPSNTKSQFPLVNQANDKMQGLQIIRQLSKQLLPNCEIQAEIAYGERRRDLCSHTAPGHCFSSSRGKQDSTDRLQQSSFHTVQHSRLTLRNCLIRHKPELLSGTSNICMGTLQVGSLVCKDV